MIQLDADVEIGVVYPSTFTATMSPVKPAGSGESEDVSLSGGSARQLPATAAAATETRSNTCASNDSQSSARTHVFVLSHRLEHENLSLRVWVDVSFHCWLQLS